MSTILRLLLLVFIIFNIVTKGKLFICIYLCIKDLIKMDKRRFKGYGFWLFCGLGGSGKTLSLAWYLFRMKKRYPKLKIYTNFRFKYSDGLINGWEDIINLENYELIEISREEYQKKIDKMEVEEVLKKDDKYYLKRHNGIIFGFDEIHLTFASHKWENCPDNMLEYISQQRKLHKQIIGTAQVFTRVDIKLREQANYVVECKAIGGRWVFNKYFIREEYEANGNLGDKGTKKRRRKKRYSFIAYDYIRELYDTMQTMVDLKQGKTNKNIEKDKIKQLLSM